jgi:hypothetical protein
MVLITNNTHYWNNLSKYNLPFYFIEIFKYQINWSNLFLFNKFTYNNTFLLKYESFWINNKDCINVIFNNTVYDEILISIYPQLIDWKVNLVYNHLSFEILSMYKDYYINYLLNEPFLNFIEICKKNNYIYNLCFLDYCKFNSKHRLYKELIEYLNSPKFIINWIETGHDYNGEPFNLL